MRYECFMPDKDNKTKFMGMEIITADEFGREYPITYIGVC